MNRMIGCGEALTSAMTAFKRFSNSPFTPAPACSSPRSSERSDTFCSGGGTSPDAMRSRETFDNRRFSDARLAGQDRVVLPASRENVHDLPNLEIAAEHRVDLSGSRERSGRP